MTQRKVSHTLVLVLAMLASGASGVPMGPLVSLVGPYGWGHLGLGGGHQVGKSYSCGASYGSCAKGQDEYSMKWVNDPTLLTAVTRTVDPKSGKIEGMLAVIEDSTNTKKKHDGHGPGYGAQGGGYGFGAGAGLGAFGAGGFGGLGGYSGGYGGAYGGGYGGLGNGLMSALGAYGLYGQREASRLDLSLEVQIRYLPEPVEVLLVFTSAVDQDICTADSLGPVLTRPPLGLGQSYGSGFGASLLGGYGGRGGAGGDNLEREFGVIAQLTVQGGSNSFKIKGLGEFNKLKDLAGRGLALCEDIVMGMGGKPVCAGKTFGVLFCAKLGFSIDAPILIPEATARQPGPAQ